VCKYVNKGSDHASFALENEKDEIKTYESGRYISSSEAVWRILEFPIHERFPTVVHLAVHLENRQRVYFNEQNLHDRVNSPPTITLRYHLRMLLHEIWGSISFEALKTVNGQVHLTFKSKCKALGLLEDDENVYAALGEAALCQSPHMIRDLFTIISVFCQVTDPLCLWDKFKEYLFKDFKIRLERQDFVDAEHLADVVLNKCLSVIEDAVLELGGQSLKEYGLPQPSNSEQFDNREYLKETSYDLVALEYVVRNNEESLNDEQKFAYIKLLQVLIIMRVEYTF